MTDKEIFIQSLKFSKQKPFVNYTDGQCHERHGFVVGALMQRDAISLEAAVIKAGIIYKEFQQDWLNGKIKELI